MSLGNDLHSIDPSLIKFDEFNPRGETVEQIINDEEFHKLKTSIKQIGVLVPLIVQENNSSGTNKKYLLIDGERRLRASIDLKLPTIPARIVENDIEGRIIAYQIHQNRKAWSKPSEAKSIQSIINSIKVTNPDISEIDLKKKLIEITSHKPTAINDILKILKYSDAVQEKSSKGDIEHSYLIRIEDDFIAPVKKVYPKIVEKYGEDELREIMIRKAELKLLISTRYMMNSDFKEIFKPCLYYNQVSLIIEDFIQSPEKSASDLLKEFEDIKCQHEEGKNQENKPNDQDIANVINTIKEVSYGNISEHNNDGHSKVYNSSVSINANNREQTNNRDLKSNNIPATDSEQNRIVISKSKISGFNAIKERLENIAKQYSVEELEYIKEAIVCLGSQKALKASVLMIWASSISRILKYIEKDIPKFNTASSEMQQDKKYKWYSSSFQKNVTSIEDIKEQAKDMQLLCYLRYQEIITSSQFIQLKGHHEIRNKCAHPTSLVLSMNEVLAIFENLIKFIFTNSKLQ
jgi:ParB/RepB/Spo0J family partition protein